MKSVDKLGILWIICLVYFPIGVYLITEIKTPLSIFISFSIIFIIIVLTIHYYKRNDKKE